MTVDRLSPGGFSRRAFSRDEIAGIVQSRAGGIPLKSKRLLAAGAEVLHAEPASHGIYLHFADHVERIEEGKENVRFDVAEPAAVFEGSGRVYVATRYGRTSLGDGEEHSYLNYIERVQPSAIYAFSPSGKLEWRKPLPEGPGATSTDRPVVAEDSRGGLWVKANGMFFRLAADGGESRPVNLKKGYIYPHPVLTDSGGNAITFFGEIYQITPDLKIRRVEGTPRLLFMADGNAYIEKVDYPFRRIERIDFESGRRQEIFRWFNDKEALGPLNGKDGILHLVLRSWPEHQKEGLYLQLDLRAPADRRVKRQTRLPFGIKKDSRPVLTPSGTLYLLGENREVFAVDAQGRQHCLRLESEPIGLFNSKGERVLAATGRGEVYALEAKSPRELSVEHDERERDAATDGIFSNIDL